MEQATAFARKGFLAGSRLHISGFDLSSLAFVLYDFSPVSVLSIGHRLICIPSCLSFVLSIVVLSSANSSLKQEFYFVLKFNSS